MLISVVVSGSDTLENSLNVEGVKELNIALESVSLKLGSIIGTGAMRLHLPISLAP